MTLRAPFPYFGGKRAIAPVVWQAFGDVGGYIEPFAGSAAVLLARPPFTGRRVETLNDADGWLVNTWRAIKLSPNEVAKHLDWPLTEIDLHARLAWLQARRDADLVAWLEGDPEHHDAKAAAWWLYVTCGSIGPAFANGPWQVVDGHLRCLDNRGQGVKRKVPHLGDAGRGVNRELPHLGDAGQGVNRELPHLGDAGQGVSRVLSSGVNDLASYMHVLATRLRYTRITCGNWRRVLTPSASRATASNPHVAVLLDPPYSVGADLYAGRVNNDLPSDVRKWCLTADKSLRIVLCGYLEDHDELLQLGWRKVLSRSTQGAGYQSAKGGKNEADRERLWLSPACLQSQLNLTLD